MEKIQLESKTNGEELDEDTKKYLIDIIEEGRIGYREATNLLARAAPKPPVTAPPNNGCVAGCNTKCLGCT